MPMLQQGVLLAGSLIILLVSQLGSLPFYHLLSQYKLSLWLLFICSLLGLFSLSKHAHFLKSALACISLITLIPLLIVRHGSVLDQQLPKSFDGQSFDIVGQVVGLPTYQAFEASTKLSPINATLGRWKFDIELSQTVLPESFSEYAWPEGKGRVRLSWYQKPRQEAVQVEPGQWLCIEVKLKRPRGLVNFTGFDYQLSLIRQGIVARGYVKKSLNQSCVKPSGFMSYRVILDRWRWSIKQQLAEWGAHWPSYDLLLALSLGDKSELSKSRWQQLTQFGLNHLLAISGLHIGLAAALGLALGRFMAAVLSLRIHTIPILAYLPLVVAFLSAFVYAALSGLAIPAQRALIMLSLLLIACALKTRMSALAGLNVAFFCVLMLDPLAGLDKGFWLSFLAVAVLIVVFRNQKVASRLAEQSIFKRYASLVFRFFQGLWDCQKLLFVALAPALILFFGVLYPVGLMTNLIMVPLVSMLVVPMILVAFILWFVDIQSLSAWLFEMASDLLSLAWGWLAPLAAVPGISLAHCHPLLLVVVFTFLLMALDSFLGRAIRSLSLVSCLALLFWAQPESPNTTTVESLKARFYDVGQGLAVLVEVGNYWLLYDTGPKLGPSFDAGRLIVEDLLIRGQKLDTLVISHPDKDHIGGLETLMSYHKPFPKRWLPGKTNLLAHHSSDNDLEVFADRQMSALKNQLALDAIKDCHTTPAWLSGGASFEFLPLLDDSAHSLTLRNYRSCVLLIRWKGLKLVLTGDIDKLRERQLIQSYGEQLSDVAVISVPHHGSKTSSSGEFLNHLTPDLAVINAGFNNRYHHPNTKVVNRYHERDIRVLNTALEGAIDITFESNGELTVDRARHQRRRFWFD